MARFTTLYSGSSGNCAVVEHAGQFLLVDMGGSCKATLAGLLALELSPRQLGGILLTHEHSDHIKGLRVFLKRVKVPVYGTAGTLNALCRQDAVPEDAQLVPLAPGQAAQVAGLGVACFATSHDAADCCGWRLDVPGGPHMAIATDLGCMTGEVYRQLEGAALVALEANYDAEMLRLGRYPAYLKRRIASPTGHLSNTDCAATVARLVAAGTSRVALCHLSKENNHPDLVRRAIAHALLEHGVMLPQNGTVRVAQRHQPDAWLAF